MSVAESLITKIILKGETDPTLSKAFSNASKSVNQSMSVLSKYGTAFKNAAKVGGAAITGLAATSLKSAIDFESAFAGVQKTIDETDTTKYEDLAKGIRQMATEMPTAADEIANVAANAGQLGIKADDILQFSKVMVQLGETTNLSSEEAADSIARLFNVTGTSMDYVDEFGATLVALGNNSASTEAEIMELAARIAGAGNQVGFTETQILALATSLASVGINAEAGGSAISTIMSNIDKDVAKNNETLQVWAETAGMSASQFRQAWETDAYSALQAVIKGMDDATKNGENLNLILEDLGVNEIRQTDTLKRLSSASDLMTEMTELSNKAWQENTALTNEAETRYATLESQLNVTKNKFTEMGITIGEHLMPYVRQLNEKLGELDFEEIANKITGAIDWVIEHIGLLKGAAATITGIFASIKIAKFITDMMELYTNLKKLKVAFMGLTVVQTVIKAIQSWSVVTKLAAAGQAILNASLWACPITWIIAGIAALVAGFILLWNNCEGFREFWIGLWNKIVAVCGPVIDTIVNFFTVTLPNAINGVINWFKELPDKVSKFFSELPEKISTFLQTAIDKVSEWASNLWAKAKEAGSNFVNGVVDFFTNLPYKIGFALGYALGTIAKWVISLGVKAYEAGANFVDTVVTFFSELPSKIWTWLQDTWTKVTTWATKMWNKAVEVGTEFVNNVVQWIQTLPERLWLWLQAAWQRVVNWATFMWNMAVQTGAQFVNNVVTWISTLPSRIWTWLTTTISNVATFVSDFAQKAIEAGQQFVDNIVQKVSEIPGKMVEIGSQIVNGIWEGISGAAGWLWDQIAGFAGGIVDGALSALGIKSPSRVFRDMVGQYIPSGIGVGILKNAKDAIKPVTQLSKSMVDTAANAVSAINPTITPVIGKAKTIAGNAFEKAKNAVKHIPKYAKGGTVTSPHTAIVGDAPETIVPHGNNARNRSLLSEAAKGVGASVGGNTEINITFAPVINGGGNVEDNRKMLREEEEEFERRIEAYFSKKGRLSFDAV